MSMSRLMFSHFVHKLGTPGVAGIVLLAFSLALALSTLLPSWHERDRLRAGAAVARDVERRNGARVALPDYSPAAQLRAFYAVFPLSAEAPVAFSLVYAAAEEANLDLLRGEYTRTTDWPTGLVLYHMTLPVRASYSQVRHFVAAALKAVPTLALDELSFERPKIFETQVQARIRFTLYLKLPS
ncbi:hypothetical protein [Massilia glaciei]|uniref:Uncharacterized protein n=1 Tax=Massilia glaciei TaxID=1524097 RepID=A0A2U2HC86_9BURK|nr:hypothetical protein [Massilia glaciei]PWF40452.1 hypothetical protein C7C56_026115 [Massilia glaciei]